MGYRTYKMTFREFIKKLNEGWSWWKHWYPQDAANALKELLSSSLSEIESRPVRVIYETGTKGSLPWYYYEYYCWTIKNIQLLPYVDLSSADLKIIDEPDRIIVYHPACKFVFFKNEPKSEIWLEWESKRL